MRRYIFFFSTVICIIFLANLNGDYLANSPVSGQSGIYKYYKQKNENEEEWKVKNLFFYHINHPDKSV